MLVNKIGDLGLLLGLFYLYFSTKGFSYVSVHAISININFSPYIFDFISMLLMIGVAGKSAQVGLHIWLPDAMEGPTPVSALIHAATMVTAGVYLIIRCSFIFEQSYFGLTLVAICGGITALFGSFVGVAQNDIKRIIAFSTCSQLGYMVLIAGLSGYKYSLYHLSTHAVFKGLLFLSAGAILHALIDEQDSRKLGGNIKQIPYVYLVFVVGSFALMGMPFMAGFYSKDLIIEFALSTSNPTGA